MACDTPRLLVAYPETRSDTDLGPNLTQVASGSRSRFVSLSLSLSVSLSLSIALSPEQPTHPGNWARGVG